MHYELRFLMLRYGRRLNAALNAIYYERYTLATYFYLQRKFLVSLIKTSKSAVRNAGKVGMNYYRIAQQKFKKAVSIARILRFIPGVLLIAVSNSLSYNRAKNESDIDLFIITSRSSAWVVRFMSLSILTVLHKRPSPHLRDENKNRDKICLSFFITEEELDIEPYKICVHDAYLRLWIQNLKPLYEEKGMYKKFIQANQWAFTPTPYEGVGVYPNKKFLMWGFAPHKEASAITERTHNTFLKEQLVTTDFPLPYIPNYKRRIRKPLLKYFYLPFLFSFFDHLCKWIQIKKMPFFIKHYAYAWDTKVVLGERIIKTHTNDRRLQFKNVGLRVEH